MLSESGLQRRNHQVDRPYAVISEVESAGRGLQATALTVFLTAAECPIGCNMCDLWQNTLPTQTAEGTITLQIDWALKEHGATEWIKLYNSGNFFDPRSIPEKEYEAIADRCAAFSRVIVENHPRFGGHRLQRFRDRLKGKLEVAVGLETVQPRWLQRMGKRMTRDEFDAYARHLIGQQVDLRVFLIVGVPGVRVAEAIRWAKLSVRHAIAVGARHISLIPCRSGHGWSGQADQLPAFDLSELEELQQWVIEDADGGAVVAIDLWDVVAKTNRERMTLARMVDRNINQAIEIQ